MSPLNGVKNNQRHCGFFGGKKPHAFTHKQHIPWHYEALSVMQQQHLVAIYHIKNNSGEGYNKEPHVLS